jgi:O-antigen ligase
MNQELNFFEKRFTIFSLLFFSGILALSSFYVAPDAKADAEPVYSPLDSVLSVVQLAIYGIVIFLIVARWKSSTRTAIRDPWVWLFAGCALFSFIWSDFPDWTLKKGITTMQTTSFGLYMASRYSLKEQLEMLGWAMGIIAVFSLLFSAAFPGAAIEAGVNAGSLRGPFVQKNVLARMMVLGSIVFLLLALENHRHRKLLLGGLSLTVLLILLTGSKTALLLFLTIVILLPLYKALRWSDTLLIPVIITLIVITGSIAVIVVGNWENILLGLGRDPTLSGRTTMWEVAIELIAKRPWLGYGYQGFWQEGGGAEVIWKEEGYKPPHAHNGFINITLDLGLTGLFLLLSTLGVTYGRGIVWLRLCRTAIGLWPIFYVTFFFMYNHSENTIIEHNSIFWVLLVAVSLSMKRLVPVNREENEDQPAQKSSLNRAKKSQVKASNFIDEFNSKSSIDNLQAND